MRIQNNNIAPNPIRQAKKSVATSIAQAKPAPADSVSLSHPPAPRWKQRAVNLAAWALAAGHTLCSLPGNVAVGLAVAAGQGADVQRSRAAITYAARSAAVGGALGSLVGGPVGMVCGAIAGYIPGNISNHLLQRSGLLDRQLEAVSQGVQPGQGQRHHLERRQAGRPTGRARNAGPRPSGNDSSARTGQRQGHLEANVGCRLRSHRRTDQRTRWSRGALEALRDNDEAKRGEVARPLMLVATNVGKVIPGAFVAPVLSGPVGVAVGTAVGVVTASLTSIIDGKSGIHSGITRR